MGAVPAVENMGKVTRTKTQALKKLELLITDADQYEAQVGWFGGKYDERRGGADVPYVAAIMNYGDPENGLQPRPFMEPTQEARRDVWVKQCAVLAKRVIAGEISVRDVFEQLGAGAAGDVRKTIESITTPVLKDATIKARARFKHTSVDGVNKQPLKFEGILINTLNHQVKDKKQ